MVTPVRPPPERGEVWLINLDPTVGREIRKTRPCVVISPDELNAHLSTLLVAPLTSGSHPAPFRVATKVAGKTGLMLLEQVRAVDQGRLVKKLDALDGSTLDAALAVLRSLFAA